MRVFGEADVFDVPGAFELPLAAKYCAESGRYAGVACLGAVIRGETDHYEYVCAEAARGIQDVQLRTGVPCAFGVLTVETMDQALARAGGDKRDQGRHAAEAVMTMAANRTLIPLGLLRLVLLGPLAGLARRDARVALRALELGLHGAALVGVLEPLGQDRDGLLRAPGEAQRVAEVVEGVGARVGRAHG